LNYRDGFLYTDNVSARAALVRRALPRAAFHAAIGIALASALYLLPRLLVLIALALATAGLLAIELVRLRSPALKRHFSALFAPLLRREEDSRVTGGSYFLIGCLVTALAFPVNIAVLAILFLSLGDPAAALVGTWQGRTRRWGKSLEGNAACLVVCLGVALLASYVLHGPPLLVAMSGALLAAVFQALPLPINDNLTIPIGSGLGMLIVRALIG
jgi:acyl phosphate:glycerol-3-phosphate acyltransferase